MLDSYYTPSDLADELISLVNNENINSVVDFCVGEGRLLEAAQKKWNKAKYYGTDICPLVISELKKKKPKWKLGKCDFLNTRSRGANLVLREKKFDLILSNPPFTCLGSSVHNISFEGNDYLVSNAMAFLVKAIPFLSPKGILYAILPESLGYSDKDKIIRDYLIKKYNFQIIKEMKRYTFDKCTPNIILVSINDWEQIRRAGLPQQANSANVKSIKRGSIAMHTIKKHSIGSVSLLHTTNIQNNSIVNLTHQLSSSRSLVKGPAVIIQRVGNPSPYKICIIEEKDKFVISDCLIALKVNSIKEARYLQHSIIEDWQNFSTLYRGTGARYITLSKLNQYFNLI